MSEFYNVLSYPQIENCELFYRKTKVKRNNAMHIKYIFDRMSNVALLGHIIHSNALEKHC